MKQNLSKQISELRAEVNGLRTRNAPEPPTMPLLEFLRAAWDVLEPSPFVEGIHHHVIAAWLESMTVGDTKRLVVNVPPRHTKSLLCSIIFPGWVWAHWPAMRFLFVSYADDLSDEFSVKRRMLIQSRWYQERWGSKFALLADQNQKGHFANDKGGAMIATSMGGAGTGRGGDFLIIDDAHSAKRVESDTERKATIRDYKSVFSTRLNNRRTGRILCIAQRLHTDDLPGHLLEAKFTHVFLPAIAEEKVTLILPSGRTTQRTNVVALPDGEMITRPVGSALWPEMQSVAELDGIKQELGPNFTGQYQQQPTPQGGAKFQKAWFRYFTTIGRFAILHRSTGDEKFELDECQTFQTVDLAMSIKTHADFTVILTAAVTSAGDLLVLHVDRFRGTDPDVIQHLKDAREYWKPMFQAVEKASFGLSVCQRLMNEGVSLLELTADRDKLARATVSAIQMQNGKVFFPDDAAWVSDFENELVTFPASVHDDQVDTLAYAALVQQQQMLNAASVVPIGSLGPQFRSIMEGGVIPTGRFGF